jgi:calcineurin-like phosphoesterase family protein
LDLTGRIFVTSDTHFGDPGAIDRFGRSFSDASEMDDLLVAGVNQVVGKDDLLLHLGDFTGRTAGSRSRHAQSIRERLACERIVLVQGNHDPRNKPKFDALFESVHELLSFRCSEVTGLDGDERIVLSHYPFRVWQGRHDGACHLYGHAHGTISEEGRATDVGVDSWNLRPIELSSVIELLRSRPVDFERIRPRKQNVRDS